MSIMDPSDIPYKGVTPTGDRKELFPLIWLNTIVYSSLRSLIYFL